MLGVSKFKLIEFLEESYLFIWYFVNEKGSI